MSRTNKRHISSSVRFSLSGLRFAAHGSESVWGDLKRALESARQETI